MAYKVSSLHIYPVKALAGISLSTAKLTATGFEYDRYWMLVDEAGKAVTQRDIPQLALFNTQLQEGQLIVTYQGQSIQISFDKPAKTIEKEVTVWDNTMKALVEDDVINEWFSQQLERQVYLVRTPSDKNRFTKRHPDAAINFPDSSPYLLVGNAALKTLNSKLEEAIPMDRFRANIVFDGGSAHEEDEWSTITIGAHSFAKNKLCARCKVITIDQQTAIASKEPLASLAQYRRVDNKVFFGVYFKQLEEQKGQLSVGDEITLVSNPI